MSLIPPSSQTPPQPGSHALLSSGASAWANPWLVFWRRKTTFSLVMLLGTLSTILFYRCQDQVYQSSSQLLIVAGEASDRPQSTISTKDYLKAQIDQIKSPMIVRQVVNNSLNDLALPVEETNDATERLKIEVNGNLLKMTFKANSSNKSREHLVAIIDGFQGYLRRTPRSNHYEAGLRLTETIHQLEVEIAQNQQAYTNLLKPTPFAGSNRSIHDQVDERLKRFENERQQLQIRKAELERQRDAQPSSDAGNQALGSGGLASSPEFGRFAARELFESELHERLLASRARGNRPEVRRATQATEQIRQLYAEVGKHAALEEEITELEQSILAVERLLETERRKAQQWSDVSVEATRLINELKLKEDLLSNFKQQLHRRNFASELETCRLRIMAPAEAGNPRSLRAIAICFVLPGLVASLSVGVALAYCEELFDHGFHSPNEIQRSLGVPLLGELPFFSSKVAAQEQSTLKAIVANYRISTAGFAEQFRKIRTSLVVAATRSRGNVVLVTSPREGDGKTLAAVNLAAAAAQTGKKILLIDANIRNPQLHQVFTESNQAGLTDLLAYNTDWKTVVQPTLLANVDLLTSGQLRGSSTELLSSPHWTELLKAARSSYDYLIIDCPAFMESLDPLVLANTADKILLLLRVGRSSRADATQVFERLGVLTRKVAGVIMNNVQNHRHVWRTDPLEAFLRMHQPHRQPQVFEKHENASSHLPIPHVHQPTPPLSGLKRTENVDPSELETMLNELSAEVRQVVSNTKQANSISRAINRN